MMVKIVASSQDYKECCTDFFVQMHRGVASVQRIEFSNSTHSLFESWCRQPQRGLLNQYCEAQISSIISTLLEGVEACVVAFQIGPSFSFQFNTTATEDGWLAILDSSGVNIIATESIQVELFYDDRKYDFISSHWSNIDPCRDSECITKPKILAVKISHKKQEIAALAQLNEDVKEGGGDYSLMNGNPSLFYLVHFFQDLAFLRGLVARIGYENLYVIVNDGNLAFHHLVIVKKFLSNHAVANSYLRDFDVNEMNAGDILLTSTLGPLSPMHLSCSRLIVKARELQVVTITLQHGITLPDVFTTVTEYTLAWSESAAKEIMARSHSVLRSKVFSAGNVRPIYKPSPNMLTNKFGNWVSNFENRVMIATNLHWAGVHGVSGNDVNTFILNISKNNPDTLFFVRPHPEDYSLSVDAGISNVIFVDDIITGLLDVSVEDILVNCDLLFSTYSTLLYDAARNNIPFVAFDYLDEVARDSHLYSELPSLERIDKLSLINDFRRYLKKQNSYVLSVDNDKFEQAVLICANLGGHSIDDDQLTALSEISNEYAIIAPDYGRSAYKSRLEDAFMVGLN